MDFQNAPANQSAFENKVFQTTIEKTVSLSEQAELKRLESKRRMTFIFFVAGFLYVLIAFPASFSAAYIGFERIFETNASSLRRRDGESSAFIYLPRFPYALVAFIDPFLFAASNTMVKEKLKKTWSKIHCCCCTKKTKEK